MYWQCMFWNIWVFPLLLLLLLSQIREHNCPQQKVTQTLTKYTWVLLKWKLPWPGHNIRLGTKGLSIWIPTTPGNLCHQGYLNNKIHRPSVPLMKANISQDLLKKIFKILIKGVIPKIKEEFAKYSKHAPFAVK